MAKSIKAEDLGAAIEQELTVYHQDLVDKLDNLSAEAAKKLVKLTKSTAPEGKRGAFKKNITCKRTDKHLNGSTYTWYVKPPDHRLTHLLVHGHATKDGGRTKPNPFLQKAVDTVLPEYEKAVEEAVQG